MKKFKKIYIEISNICNLKCSFCPTSKRTAKSLLKDEFKIILEKIKPFTKYIYLHVKGEPLFHKEIIEFLKISKELGFFVNITTNGTLISKYSTLLSRDLAPRQINFSLHSFDGNLDSINNDNYLNNIINFTKESLKNNKTYISLRLWNFNQDDKDSIQQKGNRKILEVIEKEFHLDYKISDILTPGKGLKITDKLFINSDLEFKWPDIKDTYENENGFCYGLRNQIAILSNGVVVPCCLDGEGIINLGNILEEDFKDILEKERTKDIFNGFSNNKAVEKLCKKCQFKNKFE